MCVLSHVQLFVTPCPPDSSVHGIFQARIMGGLLFPSLEDLPDQGLNPASPTLAGRFCTADN